MEGKSGEYLAEAFLKRKGYRIVSRNYHSQWGEIDLIAKDVVSSTIIFIEVKSFKQNSMVHPLETITLKKQEKIRLTAELYIQENNLEMFDFRFDVISLINRKIDQHIEQAFV